MKSKRSHEGFLEIHPGMGPALSLEEAAKTGKEIIGAGARGKIEAGILTCSHCQKQVMVNPLRTRDRNWCSKCDHYICDQAGCNAGCHPWKAYLDALEKKAFRELALANTGAFALRTPAPVKPKKPLIIIP